MLLIWGNTVFKNDLINGIGCITNLSFLSTDYHISVCTKVFSTI